MCIRRPVIKLLIILLVVLAISSCFLKDPEQIAIRRFINDVKAEGEPEEPFVGIILGQLKEGDIVSSVKADGQQEAQFHAQASILKSGWLFYLYMAPGAFYDHLGRLIFAGENNEIIFDQAIEGWPTLNGEMPLPIKVRTEYVKAVIWDKWKIARIHIGKSIIDVIARIVRKGAVITSGLTPTQSLYAEARDARDLVSAAFKSLLVASNVIDAKYAAGGAAPNWVAVQNAMNDLIINQKMNFLTLYFVAHGNTNLMNLGGTTFYASQLRSHIIERPDVMFCIIIETCASEAGSTGLSQTE